VAEGPRPSIGKRASLKAMDLPGPSPANDGWEKAIVSLPYIRLPCVNFPDGRRVVGSPMTMVVSQKCCFNSYGFIFLFLPVVLPPARFRVAAASAGLAAGGVLGLASLVFYAASGNWQFVPLLVASIAVQLCDRPSPDRKETAARRPPCGADRRCRAGRSLVILGIFKYAGFFRRQISTAVFATRLNRRHPACRFRHLLLHLHPDRVPGPTPWRGNCRRAMAAGRITRCSWTYFSRI